MTIHASVIIKQHGFLCTKISIYNTRTICHETYVITRTQSAKCKLSYLIKQNSAIKTAQMLKLTID
ncbi:hypothetical protein T11_7647 [Trichinella zimbabwensis]|uniref:Uncharacterized protein n=1 Tax=Trichinella zimbabwensis TaxID=268475 RepID=A0A0V1HML3_9BILA|nr:hypothetical protein T11_7647 [Trichinella zimbabwensis]